MARHMSGEATPPSDPSENHLGLHLANEGANYARRSGGAKLGRATTKAANSETEHLQAAQEVRYGFEAADHSMNQLIQQLAPKIKNSRWQSVLGDDASGRLPALVVGKVMNRWAEEHGERAPAQLFVATGQEKSDKALVSHTHSPEQIKAEKSNNLRDYIAQISPQLGERTLVVTEHVRRESISTLARTLHDNGIAFDLAVVESYDTPEAHLRSWREQFPDVFDDVTLYSGQSEMRNNNPVFKLDEMRQASGVKRVPLSPVSVPEPSNQPYALAARREATNMADVLYSKHFL